MMSHTTRIGPALLIGLSLVACQTPAPTTPAPSPTPAPTATPAPVATPTATPVPVPSPTPAPVGGPVFSDGTTGAGAFEEVTEAPVETVVKPSRVRKRLDIDQLDASIRRVTGGIGWVEVRNGKEVNLFVDLAETLGKPDYQANTREDLSPSVIFEKFLGDAARSVCTTLAEQERTLPASQRWLMVTVNPSDTLQSAPDAVDANLRLLLKRYHGRVYEPQALELNPWSWLFQSTVQVTGDPVKGWRAVCVALIQHPDFYTE